MENQKKRFSRRNFIRLTAQGTAGLLLFPEIQKDLYAGLSGSSDLSRVVVVRDKDVVPQSISSSVVKMMTDEAIRALTGIDDIGEAWLSLFPGITRKKVISFKINCINRNVSTHPEVVLGVLNSMTQMKVDGSSFPKNNIIVWDRRWGELKNAGYTINTGGSGIRYMGTDNGGGYHTRSTTIMGKSIKVSRIITDISDYIINFSVLKNHSNAGVTLSLKNHYGSVNDPGILHTNNCNPYIPLLNMVEHIRQKQVLNICDAIYGIWKGGPSGYRQITPKRLIFSKDPVAHDTIGSQILESYGCISTAWAHHVPNAAKSPYNLGTSDINQIELISIDNPTIPTGITRMDELDTPDQFVLHPNYPNPFNGETVFSYKTTNPGLVRLQIFNIRGQLIKTLVNQFQKAGMHQINWNGTDRWGYSISSGTYLARLQVEDRYQTIRLQAVK